MASDGVNYHSVVREARRRIRADRVPRIVVSSEPVNDPLVDGVDEFEVDGRRYTAHVRTLDSCRALPRRVIENLVVCHYPYYRLVGQDSLGYLAKRIRVDPNVLHDLSLFFDPSETSENDADYRDEDMSRGSKAKNFFSQYFDLDDEYSGSNYRRIILLGCPFINPDTMDQRKMSADGVPLPDQPLLGEIPFREVLEAVFQNAFRYLEIGGILVINNFVQLYAQRVLGKRDELRSDVTIEEVITLLTSSDDKQVDLVMQAALNKYHLKVVRTDVESSNGNRTIVFKRIG